MEIQKIQYPDGTFYPIISANNHDILTYRINSYEDMYKFLIQYYQLVSKEHILDKLSKELVKYLKK